STARRSRTVSWPLSTRSSPATPGLCRLRHNRAMARRHRAALAAGSLLSIAALLPPVERLADQRLSLHMLQEMLVLAIAVPLLAYGLSPLRFGRATSWLHPVAGIMALNLVLFGSQLPAVLDLATG